jgi:alkaline phosphatase
LQVILGGGRRHLLPENIADPRLRGYFGKRTDGRHLMEEWLAAKREMNARHALAMTKKEFDAVDPNATDYLMGKYEHIIVWVYDEWLLIASWALIHALFIYTCRKSL